MIFDGNFENMRIINKISEYMPELGIKTVPHVSGSKRGFVFKQKVYCYSLGHVKSDLCASRLEASKNLLQKLRQEYNKQYNKETHEL